MRASVDRELRRIRSRKVGNSRERSVDLAPPPDARPHYKTRRAWSYPLRRKARAVVWVTHCPSFLSDGREIKSMLSFAGFKLRCYSEPPDFALWHPYSHLQHHSCSVSVSCGVLAAILSSWGEIRLSFEVKDNRKFSQLVPRHMLRNLYVLVLLLLTNLWKGTQEQLLRFAKFYTSLRVLASIQIPYFCQGVHLSLQFTPYLIIIL